MRLNKISFILLFFLFFQKLSFSASFESFSSKYVTQTLPFFDTKVTITTPFLYRSLPESERATTVFVHENYFAIIGKEALAQQAIIGPCRPCVAVMVYTSVGQALVFHKHITQSCDEAIIRQTKKTLAETKSTIIFVRFATQALFAKESQERHGLTLEAQFLQFERLKTKLEKSFNLKKENIDQTFIEKSLNDQQYFYGSDNTFLATPHPQEIFSTSLFHEGIVIAFTKKHLLSDFFFFGYVDLTKKTLREIKEKYDDQKTSDFIQTQEAFMILNINRTS